MKGGEHYESNLLGSVFYSMCKYNDGGIISEHEMGAICIMRSGTDVLPIKLSL